MDRRKPETHSELMKMIKRLDKLDAATRARLLAQAQRLLELERNGHLGQEQSIRFK